MNPSKAAEADAIAALLKLGYSQSVAGEAVARAAEVAMERWQGYEGKRTFAVERVTLVQNTVQNNWRNLQEFRLRTPVIAWI